MSNRNNPRRGDKRRSENGPVSYGSASHVAHGRKNWRVLIRRRARRLFNLGEDYPRYYSGYKPLPYRRKG